MDKLVEIVRFTYPAEAQTLMALLRSEGIDCYLRNEITSQLYAGSVDVGGARVEIREEDVQRALEVMRTGGYEIPDEDEGAEQVQAVAGWTRHVPLLRNFSLEGQIMILFVLVAVCLSLLIFLDQIFLFNINRGEWLGERLQTVRLFV